MNKLQLSIDTESINQENEAHTSNFYKKVQSLAEHCVKHLEGRESNEKCDDRIFDKNCHDSVREEKDGRRQKHFGFSFLPQEESEENYVEFLGKFGEFNAKFGAQRRLWKS